MSWVKKKKPLAPCKKCILDSNINEKGEYWYIYNPMCKTHRRDNHYIGSQLTNGIKGHSGQVNEF